MKLGWSKDPQKEKIRSEVEREMFLDRIYRSERTVSMTHEGEVYEFISGS